MTNSVEKAQKTRLRNIQQNVDAQLIAWLKEAYESAG